ncbi:response regulator transcription factor [Flavobacterium sp. NKUCC04_CG]|uniref:response regulator transcription factor n=1 Tax=Flavobacterium sp. NKUCC04_CG TaxID=2842121 RepID=UPI001C5AB8EA|nr:response regulator transcription factor [Flavobacterium sp. NKUCC04_CG]MBW3519733.1 response regulator transcription factor [Flavobacterium sp. NKUCC04_CG]
MKILIVEDEIGITNFLKQGLEEEGYTVMVAANGSSGKDLYDQNAFDLCLLDWMLPKMSGLELCRYIRSQDALIPILFLTAKDTVAETITGLRAGANDYIKKPFSFEELLERIKIHFRVSDVPELLKWSDVVLDLNQYQVFKADKEISFTPREFEFLKFLIENKGKICTRNQIIDAVWQTSFEYDTGVIDVFMNAIRKKLKLKKDDARLKTIRGVGFLLND